MELPDPDHLHLARRATYGPTPALLAEIRRDGADTWLRGQLRPGSVDDSACAAVAARFPGAVRSVDELRAANAYPTLDPMYELVRAHVARAFWSRRQLLEVMVDFWSNHLNVTCPSGDVWDSRCSYDARAIRPHALGRFADLLVAATTHPAMLTYLDNASSTREHPNENHGRELLELHTVGIDAGYTERDVRDSARILTGLGVDPITGRTVYQPERHHVGPVRVLGFRHANPTAAGGPQVVAAYLRWLAGQPATARTVARKLAVRFVRDDPPESLVTRLAGTYLRSGTAVGPVLWQLFRSPEFRAAGVRMRKLRRPFEDVAATVRLLGVEPERHGTGGVEALTWTLDTLGHSPLGWPQPDGYPDVAAAWASPGSALGRWTPHLQLAAGWWPKQFALQGVRAILPGPPPADPLAALTRRLLFREPTAAHRAAARAYLGGPVPVRVADRLPELAALLLDAPEHVLR